MSGEDKQIMDLMNTAYRRIAEMQEEENEAEIDVTVEYVEIDDEKVIFVEKELIPEGLKMYVPNYFEKMPEILAKIKYPYEARPEYIYSNPSHSMSLTFKLFDTEVNEEDLPNIRDSFKNTMLMIDKSNEDLGEDIIEMSDLKLPYFEIKTSAIDSDIYNLMFLTIVKGKLVMGSFNCPVSDKDDWQKPAKAMIKTIL